MKRPVSGVGNREVRATGPGRITGASGEESADQTVAMLEGISLPVEAGS